MSERVTEKDWQSRVVDLARLFEWRYMHVYPLRRAGGVRTATTTRGWPDLILVKGPLMLAIELKAAAGSTTPEQRDWLEVLAQVPGVQCFVWRPRDWPQVVEVLTGGRAAA